MGEQRFRLIADVSSDDPAAIEPVLHQLPGAVITSTESGFHVEATVAGTSARDVNRSLLSALRRVQRHTRLRAEWTADGVTHRFFDYALKATRQSVPGDEVSE